MSALIDQYREQLERALSREASYLATFSGLAVLVGLDPDTTTRAELVAAIERQTRQRRASSWWRRWRRSGS